jgi:hypothetical protein
MTDQTQEVEPRSVIVDDVSYVVDELPEAIQNAITTYDVWTADQRDAQKKAAQLTAAVQQLSQQILTAIREHVAAEEAAEAGAPESGETAEADSAEASLDIPADEDE